MYITEPGFYLVIAHEGFEAKRLLGPGSKMFVSSYSEHLWRSNNPHEDGVIQRPLDSLRNSAQHFKDGLHVLITRDVKVLFEFNDAERTYVVSPEGNFKRMSDHPDWGASKGVLSPAEFWFDRFYSNQNGIDWINS